MFSRDGKRVASVARDGTVRVRPVAGDGRPFVLRDPDKPVWRAALSPDGQRVLTANGLDAVRIWRPGVPRPTELPSGHGAQECVAWSPDGRYVASGGEDGAVLVWDLRRRTPPVVHPGTKGLVWTVAFSPDGRWVASGGNDGSVRLWPVHGGAEPVVLHGHQGVVWSLAFSADGRTLATSGNDATVRLWQVTGAGTPLVLQGFRASVESVAFAPDGRLATAHDDGTVRVWRCAVCGPIADVMAFADQHLTRRLTAEERKTYLGGLP
jgi:WD40 repeat protein